MNFFKLEVLKTFSFLILLVLTLTSCANNNLDKAIKKISGSNNFEWFVEDLVDDSSSKFKKHLYKDDIVLVSDFVNLDRLKNRSKLGFLLSDYLKNALLEKDILVRQVELGENFQIGRSGFNLLTRDANKIQKDYIDNARYAVVGTYSITTRSLIVFVKLIDLSNGTILSSSTNKTAIDAEILDLERTSDKKDLVVPHMVL